MQFNQHVVPIRALTKSTYSLFTFIESEKILTTGRDVLKTIAATGVAMVMTASENVFAANAGLSWKHFPAGEHGFYRAPVLITGEKEAVLIDAGFTFSDGKALVEAIKASGKVLTTIYISQSDPDYYFSLAPIKAAFPSAKVITASATIDAIKANVDKKLAVWGGTAQGK